MTLLQMPQTACCARLRSLEGYTVAVTADRRAEEQIVLLEHLGARVLGTPMVHTTPLADVAPLEQATRKLIDDPCEVLIATTGIGMRGWLSAARAWGLDVGLTGALATARIAVRGSKARATLREVGLPVWFEEESERLDRLIEKVIANEPAGTHVALQLYGEPADEFVDALHRAGMRVTEIPVYQWTLPNDMPAAERLIQLVAEAGVDAITFTSGPSVENFFAIASRLGIDGPVATAMNDDVVAMCVGPTTAAVLRSYGVTRAYSPETGRLGLMVRELSLVMARRHHHIAVEGLDVAVQGTVIATDHGSVDLQGRESDVFLALVERPGAIVANASLLRNVWERGADDSVVAKTISRLRADVEPLGLTVRNVAKRGYVLGRSRTADLRVGHPEVQAPLIIEIDQPFGKTHVGDLAEPLVVRVDCQTGLE